MSYRCRNPKSTIMVQLSADGTQTTAANGDKILFPTKKSSGSDVSLIVLALSHLIAQNLIILVCMLTVTAHHQQAILRQNGGTKQAQLNFLVAMEHLKQGSCHRVHFITMDQHLDN